MSLVVLVTTLGVIKLSLFNQTAPSTVNYFLNYVKSGYYNGTIFHRIMDGFVIQGGAYDMNFNRKLQPTFSGSSNADETSPSSYNTLGTIAMATDPKDPSKLEPQFFINLADNDFLDSTKQEPGYHAFGKVTAGFDVIQKIAHVKLGQREGMYNIPFYPQEVIIKSIAVQ